MAKVKPGIIGIKGKIDNKIICQGSRKESYTREPVEPGSKMNEPALKANYQRTAYLNNLSSQVSEVSKGFNLGGKTKGFYNRLHSRFRDAEINNRYLCLLQTKGMDINPDYPLSRFDMPLVSGEIKGSSIIVNLQVNTHPDEGEYKANCYYYEAILVQWKKGNKDPKVSSILSEWTPIKYGFKKHPVFAFKFPKEINVQQWLLMVRICLGIDEKEFEYMATEAMRIMEAGTTLKSDLALARKMEKNKKEKQKKKWATKKKEERTRVKATKYV